MVKFLFVDLKGGCCTHPSLLLGVSIVIPSLAIAFLLLICCYFKITNSAEERNYKVSTEKSRQVIGDYKEILADLINQNKTGSSRPKPDPPRSSPYEEVPVVAGKKDPDRLPSAPLGKETLPPPPPSGPRTRPMSRESCFATSGESHDWKGALSEVPLSPRTPVRDPDTETTTTRVEEARELPHGKGHRGRREEPPSSSRGEEWNIDPFSANGPPTTIRRKKKKVREEERPLPPLPPPPSEESPRSVSLAFRPPRNLTRDAVEYLTENPSTESA